MTFCSRRYLETLNETSPRKTEEGNEALDAVINPRQEEEEEQRSEEMQEEKKQSEEMLEEGLQEGVGGN